MLAASQIITRAPMLAPHVNIAMREATYKPGETAPAYLDGSMPADAGMDPLCLAALARPVGVKDYNVPYSCKGSIFDTWFGFVPWSLEERQAIMQTRTPEEIALTMNWMREAELKHARLAMLAVVGWPLAELLNPFGALGFLGGRAPSLFNGGLDAYAPFLLLAVAGAGFFELQTIDNTFDTHLSKPKEQYMPGALGFDPLGLAGKTPAALDQATNELYNGRLAMLAITGFAVQEFVWGTPVVDLPISGFFFGR